MIRFPESDNTIVLNGCQSEAGQVAENMPAAANGHSPPAGNIISVATPYPMPFICWISGTHFDNTIDRQLMLVKPHPPW
jgi:hypothetical protein